MLHSNVHVTYHNENSVLCVNRNIELDLADFPSYSQKGEKIHTHFHLEHKFQIEGTNLMETNLRE